MFRLVDHNSGQELGSFATVEECIAEYGKGDKQRAAQFLQAHFSIFDEENEMKPVKRVFAGREQPIQDRAGAAGPDINQLADAYAATQNRLDNFESNQAQKNQNLESRIADLEAAAAANDKKK